MRIFCVMPITGEVRRIAGRDVDPLPRRKARVHLKVYPLDLLPRVRECRSRGMAWGAIPKSIGVTVREVIDIQQYIAQLPQRTYGPRNKVRAAVPLVRQ